MTIEKELVTTQAFDAFVAAHPDSLYELINGEIVEKLVTQEHGIIATKIPVRLFIFVEDNKIKGHVAVEASFRAADDNINGHNHQQRHRPARFFAAC